MSVPYQRQESKVGLEAMRDYPERIDVRSGSEFVDDHLPGAESHPVLDDSERKRVGTLHAQDSEFVAKRVGAAIVARNVAAMIEGPFAEKARNWAPLVYCWRGGQRSRSLTHVLNEIGWRAVQLDGGYRAYRRHIVTELETLPQKFRYEVICGLTGSGKSCLIGALSDVGAQVLDLEGLARHRGSLLGDLPDRSQPTQKAFDSALIEALQNFDPNRAVYVESESKRIGTVQLPDALLEAMRSGDCIRVELPRSLRIDLLKREYRHFLEDSGALAARLCQLAPFYGKKTIDRWIAAAVAGDFDTLIDELLKLHYDPMYLRSIRKNFPRSVDAIEVAPAALTDPAFRSLAIDVDDKVQARSTA